MSRAEYEVALEYAKGLSDKEVAVNLFRSYWTVKTQKKAIYRKLGIKIMKELLEDFNRENFTLKEWMWYGVAYPMGVIILAMLFS